MAYSLLVHTYVAGAINGATTSPIDTSGADAVFLMVSSYSVFAAPTLSDSKGNGAPTGLSVQVAVGGATVRGQLYYYANPTVGSSHTFTTSGEQCYAGICVAAFSGSKLASPFDVESGASGLTTATLQAGSVTPSENNEIVIAGVAWATGTTAPTINESFSITDSLGYNVGVSFGMALAYLIESTAAAKNPTWTFGGSEAGIVAMNATFKAADAAGRVTKNTRAFPLGEAVGMGWRMGR